MLATWSASSVIELREDREQQNGSSFSPREMRVLTTQLPVKNIVWMVRENRKDEQKYHTSWNIWLQGFLHKPSQVAKILNSPANHSSLRQQTVAFEGQRFFASLLVIPVMQQHHNK